MMALRIFAAIAGAAAVVGLGAELFAPAERSAPPAAAPAREPAPPDVAPRAEPPAAPLPLARVPAAPRTRVPAGILSRAADARALERGRACPPPAPREPRRCLPGEEREPIEIEWHVASPR